MAVTADGKIDTVDRSGARISGPADTARVDRLRAAADAVMVGGHTLLGEDPRLTVRDPALVEQRSRLGQPAQPIKVAVVSRIGAPGGTEALPQDSRFLADGGGRVIIFTTTRTDAAAIDWLRARGVETVVDDAHRIDLATALGHLATAGVEHLMVEGGGTLVAALLAEGLVDEIQLAIAPLIFGGERAPSPVGGPGLASREVIRLSLAGVEQDGDDDVILRYLLTRDA